MALKIRLRQQGRTNHHVYRLVVMDERQARDGKYVEALGWYNPHVQGDLPSFDMKADRIAHWIDCGAQLTPKVEALLSQGVPEVMKRKRMREEAKRMKLVAERKAHRRRQKARSDVSPSMQGKGE